MYSHALHLLLTSDSCLFGIRRVRLVLFALISLFSLVFIDTFSVFLSLSQLSLFFICHQLLFSSFFAANKMVASPPAKFSTVRLHSIPLRPTPARPTSVKPPPLCPQQCCQKKMMRSQLKCQNFVRYRPILVFYIL